MRAQLGVRPTSPLRRLGTLLGPDVGAVVQTVVALVVALVGAVGAGLTLGRITDTLDRLPGLLVLVPAAIAARGAVFGALGARLGTVIHTGQWVLSPRLDTAVGQNLVAVAVLSVAGSLVMALLAKVVAVGFGLPASIEVADYVVISVVAGTLAAVVMAVVTVAMAASSVRYGWDLDNVTAPLVTAGSDLVTLPLLVVATWFADRGVVTAVLAAVLGTAAVAGTVAVLRSGLGMARRIVAESLPVLAVTGLISLVAGITIEKRLETFAADPTLLAFVPPFLATGGALGGILASRLGSKLHLGLVLPTARPTPEARRDIRFVYLLAVPLFSLAGVLVSWASALTGLSGPATLDLVRVSVLGAAIAITVAVLVAYAGSVTSFRLGLDPDNTGIPMVAATMDLAGALALVLAVTTLGVV